MDALKTFEPALKRGELKVEKGRINPNVLVHMDMPNGQFRMTYALMDGATVTGIAIIVPAEFENGLPVFQLGYAVPQHLRKRGIGTTVAQAAIDEFTSGVARGGIVHFYLEAMVGIKNVGSHKIAESVIGGEVKETTDKASGEAVLQYMVEVGSGVNAPPAT